MSRLSLRIIKVITLVCCVGIVLPIFQAQASPRICESQEQSQSLHRIKGLAANVRTDTILHISWQPQTYATRYRVRVMLKDGTLVKKFHTRKHHVIFGMSNATTQKPKIDYRAWPKPFFDPTRQYLILVRPEHNHCFGRIPSELALGPY